MPFVHHANFSHFLIKMFPNFSNFHANGEEEIKPSKILGKSMMIVTYRWELKDVERDHKTISSRMICFRDEKVFRVGLKNRDKPTLIFMAIDLNNIG